MNSTDRQLAWEDSRAWYDGQRMNIELFNSYAQRVPLGTIGRGRSAFLCCSGPSLATTDLSRLNERGVVTMGLNNSPAVFAAQGQRMPQYWCCVDGPGNFVEQIWKDASIMKFAPLGHTNARIKARDKNGILVDSSFTVSNCPNVFFYNRSGRFQADSFLTERDFNWGNAEGVEDALGFKGARSVMLVGVKMLYCLGFKTVYILGADFNMVDDSQVNNYAFAQARTTGAVNNNNRTYKALNARFDALKPYFNDAGFGVFNATPGGNLTAFERVTFEEAVQLASKEVTEKEIVTFGHYDSKGK